MRSFRWIGVAALLLLVACSKDKDIDKPAKLPVFTASIRVEKAWTANVADKGAKPLRLGLGLAVIGNRVFAAGHKGEVAAFDLNTGRAVWRVRTKLALSGGPGAGAGLVVVGSTFGDIVALNPANGAIRWKTRLNGEVLSAPAITEKLIAVRTVDGKLRGLSPEDGHELWTAEQQVPRLSLRGTSWPVVIGDLVLCGFDNGKVAAVNASDGSVQWETTIAPPHGKTEIERLDDVDGSVRVAGSDVYAVGFQGRIAMLALDNGQIWWSHEASSFRGIGLDDSALYVSTADGEIIAMRRRTGTEIWRQKSLAHRRLSAAVESDNAVVTADYQGYVHWLDKATGAIAARAKTGKVRISNSPVVAGNLVLVINDVGHIMAFRATPMGGARAAAPAETPTPDAGTSTAPTTDSAPATDSAPGTESAPPAGAPESSGSAAPAAPEEPSTPPPAQPAEPPSSAAPAEPAGSPGPASTPIAAPEGAKPQEPPSSPPVAPEPLPPEPQTEQKPPPS